MSTEISFKTYDRAQAEHLLNFMCNKEPTTIEVGGVRKSYLITGGEVHYERPALTLHIPTERLQEAPTPPAAFWVFELQEVKS